MLLDLHENIKIATAATCIISETIMDILRLHLKCFVKKIKKPIQENMANENIDLSILACKKNCREKAF